MSPSDRREWLERMGTWGSEMIFGAEILVRIYGINGTIRSGLVASAVRTSEIRIRHAGYKDRRKRHTVFQALRVEVYQRLGPIIGLRWNEGSSWRGVEVNQKGDKLG